MVDNTGRRQFLQLAGTGTMLSLAGCNAFQSSDGNETASPAISDSDTSPATGPSDSKTVMVQVQPDQQALQQRQAEIQAEVQSGNLSRQEARQELQTVQQDLLANVTESFENRVSDSSDIQIDDAIDQFGVFLVSGSPGTLIDSLSYEEVSAMFPAETFEQAKSQAEQIASGQSTPQTETPQTGTPSE